MQEIKLTFGNFAKHLASLLNDRGVTAKAVAEACGVSQAALSRYIAGQRMPRYSEAMKLADYFGIHPDYLLNPDRYRKTPFQKAREARDAFIGTEAEKNQEYNRVLKIETDSLGEQRTEWADSDTVLREEPYRDAVSEWRLRALAAEKKLARLKKLFEDAAAEF